MTAKHAGPDRADRVAGLGVRSMYASATIRVHTRDDERRRQHADERDDDDRRRAAWRPSSSRTAGSTVPVTPSVKRSGCAESSTNALSDLHGDDDDRRDARRAA